VQSKSTHLITKMAQYFRPAIFLALLSVFLFAMTVEGKSASAGSSRRQQASSSGSASASQVSKFKIFKFYLTLNAKNDKIEHELMI
jgi:hypothetical protein